MSDMRRLLRLVLPHWYWLAAGALFGVIATGSNVALMGLSAYLISKAAIATGVAELALAITGVRVLAISRAGFRYIERYTTHRAMFRILSTVRVWFYKAVEPVAPARLVHERSGDLLTRSVNDVDALEDLYIKVLVPPLVAAVVVASVSVVYGVFDLAIGSSLAFFLVLTGVVLPLAAAVVQRRYDVEFTGTVWAAVIVAGAAPLVPLVFFFRQKWRAMLSASVTSTAVQFVAAIALVLPPIAAKLTAKDST